MAWNRYVTTYGNEEEPLHAALAIDVFRNNFLTLTSNGPASVGSQIFNDGASDLTSASGPHVDGAILWRSPHSYLRYAQDGRPRGIRVWARCAVTAAGVAVMRLCTMPDYAIPADPPVQPHQEHELAIAAAVAWYEFKLDVNDTEVGRADQGTARADRGPIEYSKIFLMLQGYPTTSGPVLHVERVTVEEYEP